MECMLQPGRFIFQVTIIFVQVPVTQGLAAVTLEAFCCPYVAVNCFKYFRIELGAEVVPAI